MSTKSSIHYKKDPYLHIFHDLIDMEDPIQPIHIHTTESRLTLDRNAVIQVWIAVQNEINSLKEWARKSDEYIEKECRDLLQQSKNNTNTLAGFMLSISIDDIDPADESDDDETKIRKAVASKKRWRDKCIAALKGIESKVDPIYSEETLEILKWN